MRGRDSAGNWGAVSATYLTVIDPLTAPTVHGLVRDAVTDAPLAATVSVGPFSTTSDAGSGAYSIQVPTGTYALAASALDHASANVAAVTLSSGDSRLQDFSLVPYTAALADDVEGGNLGWAAASPWAITNLQAHSPSHSWTDSPGAGVVYGNNVDTSLVSAIQDLSQASGVHVSFWQRYETEPTFDFCHVEVSGDGGATWTELASYDGTQSTWTQVTLAAPQLDGKAQARIRFRLSTDVSVQRDGCYVDDVVLRAAMAPILSFADGFESGTLSNWDAFGL